MECMRQLRFSFSTPRACSIPIITFTFFKSFPLVWKKPFSQADTMLLPHCSCLLPNISISSPLPTSENPRHLGFHLLVSSTSSLLLFANIIIQCLLESSWLSAPWMHLALLSLCFYFFLWLGCPLGSSASNEHPHFPPVRNTHGLFCEVHHVLQKSWLFFLRATPYFLFIL